MWVYINKQAIGLMSRLLANDPGDNGPIPGWAMVLDAALLNTQYYKVWIKGKVEQSKDWNSTFSYTSLK